MNLNTRGIPILMMTASAPDTAEVQSLESGADGYIAKSESPEIVLLRIRALLRKASAQAAILNAPDAAFRSVRILTMDDSPTYRAFLSDELRSEGYDVECATSGPEGLTRLATQSFDCVLVDLAMPGMDAIEVCRRMWRV
jgi:two-component system NtrC family sensor kinase